MRGIATMRAQALDLFQTAIDAADPAKALQRHLSGAPLAAPLGGRLIVIALGKAACPMMRQALSHIAPGTEVTALAVTNYENDTQIDGCRVMLAGHPVPDANGLEAGKAVCALLDAAGAKDRVVALISGGGSALLPAPVEGVSLADKAALSGVLLGAGFDIAQMNLVRQQVSRLKGGGMLRLASPAQVTAYILSDVVGDDLRVIASGPSVAPIGTGEDATRLLKTAGVFDALPASIQAALQRPARPLGIADAARNVLICSNRQSLDAMLAKAGPTGRIIDDRLEGNVADVAPKLAQIARNAARPAILLFGGETTVTLSGTGKGGRNQDLGLRFALNAADLPGPWVFLSGGTDGRDGPTDAAGGLVDPGTLSRIKAAGGDAAALLGNNDSNAGLGLSGDLVITGGTGTNVADVQVVMLG